MSSGKALLAVLTRLPETKPNLDEHGELNGNGKSEDDLVKQESWRGHCLVPSAIGLCHCPNYRSSGEVELEWEGNMLSDSIADNVTVLFSPGVPEARSGCCVSVSQRPPILILLSGKPVY